jgi:hypothetical protein
MTTLKHILTAENIKIARASHIAASNVPAQPILKKAHNKIITPNQRKMTVGTMINTKKRKLP